MHFRYTVFLEEKISTTYAIVPFSPALSMKKFKFLKTCPYGFQNVLHRHSTPKGAPVCRKSFLDFFGFSRKLHTIRTKFSTVILHLISVVCVHFHQTGMTGIVA